MLNYFYAFHTFGKAASENLSPIIIIKSMAERRDAPLFGNYSCAFVKQMREYDFRKRFIKQGSPVCKRRYICKCLNVSDFCYFKLSLGDMQDAVTECMKQHNVYAPVLMNLAAGKVRRAER